MNGDFERGRGLRLEEALIRNGGEAYPSDEQGDRRRANGNADYVWT